MEELMAELARIGAITDVEQRAVELGEYIRDLQVALGEAIDARKMVVDILRGSTPLVGRSGPLSHQQVADLLGISRGAAQQIAEGRHKGPRRNDALRRRQGDQGV